MIIHSADDEMISQEKGFDVFYDQIRIMRFSFVKYENRGHDYIFSERSRDYQEFKYKFH